MKCVKCGKQTNREVYFEPGNPHQFVCDDCFMAAHAANRAKRKAYRDSLPRCEYCNKPAKHNVGHDMATKVCTKHMNQIEWRLFEKFGGSGPASMGIAIDRALIQEVMGG